MTFLTRLIASLSSWGYRLLFEIDNWIGLPQKLVATLHFRKNWKSYINRLQSPQKAKLWIHGASVGELEDLSAYFSDPQALLQSGYSEEDIIITASSISAKKKLSQLLDKYNFAYAGPLPPEMTREVQDFFNTLNPELLVLSQTDIWPNLLFRAQTQLRKGIFWIPQKTRKPTLLSKLYLEPLLRSIGQKSPQGSDYPLSSLENTGRDYVGIPRIDQISKRISKAKQQTEHALKTYDLDPQADKINILLASCYIDDALIFAKALHKIPSQQRQQLHIVAIPHEFKDENTLAKIKAHLPQAHPLGVGGILVEAYQNFDLCYVGGGFKTGLHNVLEPALWEKPVLIGPKDAKQADVPLLKQLGIVRSVHNDQQLAEMLNSFISSDNFRQTWHSSAQNGAKKLWQESGSAHRIAQSVKKIKDSPTKHP